MSLACNIFLGLKKNVASLVTDFWCWVRVSQPQGVILRGGPAQGGDHHRAACCHEGELDGLGGARGVYCVK